MESIEPNSTTPNPKMHVSPKRVSLEQQPKRPYLILARIDEPYLMEVGRRFEIKNENAIISAEKEADIPLGSTKSQGYKVRLYREQEGWFFENIGVRHAIYLNNYPSQENRLRDGDFLQIGQTIFQFLEGAGLQSELYQSMSDAIRIDFLTKAYNKTHFWESMEHWVAFCQRHQESLSLVVIDIDHFRKINADYGHFAADQTLRELSYRIRKRLRKEDIFCRFGGEEFTLILPKTKKDRALLFAEDIREVIANEPIQVSEYSIVVTISLGVAEFELGMDDEKLFICADKNLLCAKDAGRNRVVG